MSVERVELRVPAGAVVDDVLVRQQAVIEHEQRPVPVRLELEPEHRVRLVRE
jgi:hypothetical protein